MTLTARQTTFPQALKAARMRHAVSQAELGRRMCSDHSYISRLEAGSRHPSRWMVLDLAAGLHCSSVERDELLFAAGFAPESERGRNLLRRWLDSERYVEQAQAAVRERART